MQGAVGYDAVSGHVQVESSTTCSSLNMMSEFGSDENADTGPGIEMLRSKVPRDVEGGWET